MTWAKSDNTDLKLERPVKYQIIPFVLTGMCLMSSDETGLPGSGLPIVDLEYSSDFQLCAIRFTLILTKAGATNTELQSCLTGWAESLE